MSWERLPVEVWIEDVLLPYGEVSDFLHWCATHPDLAYWCQDEYVWKKFVERDFGDQENMGSWKSTYERLLTISRQVIRIQNEMKRSYGDMVWGMEFLLREVPSPEIFQDLPELFFLALESQKAREFGLFTEIQLYYEFPHFYLVLRSERGEIDLRESISSESMEQLLFRLFQHVPEILNEGEIDLLE